MTNACGECTLCCKLLGVVEIEKPQGEWCKHCNLMGQRGCGIYADRPHNCREFECGWLANDGSAELRPDKIHMIVAGESKEVDAYIVHVDPAYPDAPTRKLGASLLETMTMNGRHQNIILVTGSKRRFIGNNSEKIRKLLEKLKSQNPLDSTDHLE